MDNMIPFNTNSDEPIPTRSSSGIQSLADTWYRLAAPRQVSPSASFKQREIVRRGQTASWILLVVTLLVLLPVPGLLSKPAVLSIVLVVFAIDVGALVLNRFGQIRLAGVIAIFTIEVGLV